MYFAFKYARKKFKERKQAKTVNTSTPETTEELSSNNVQIEGQQERVEGDQIETASLVKNDTVQLTRRRRNHLWQRRMIYLKKARLRKREENTVLNLCSVSLHPSLWYHSTRPS